MPAHLENSPVATGLEKTRDLFIIRDTKGTFHAKMVTIKDRSGVDLTEAEEGASIYRRTVQKRSS